MLPVALTNCFVSFMVPYSTGFIVVLPPPVLKALVYVFVHVTSCVVFAAIVPEYEFPFPAVSLHETL